MPTANVDLIVNKSNYADARCVSTELPDADSLADGQALLAVDSFALTANNVSYAVSADMFGYWDFFPTEDGWGRIPVWGFADVIASKAPGVEPGERVYGYLPMSTHLVVEPTPVKAGSFLDGAAHRRERSPIYNQYAITRLDPGYHPDHEALISLFRPLFTTSFLLDDEQGANNFFGADAVILSSASSKTAIGVAWLLARRGAVKVIGLTSAGNRRFVAGLGCYDQVLEYDDVESLDLAAANFIDMAGNSELRRRIHTHLGDRLKRSTRVGLTHWNAAAEGGGDLPGPRPEVFFAPGYAQGRIAEWGLEGFAQRMGEVWAGFIPQTATWIQVSHGRGQQAVMDTWQALLANRVSPTEGQIVSLHDPARR